MIHFIKEYVSWLGLLLFLNVLINILMLLDAGLANISQTYFNVIYIGAVLLFCVWRAHLDKQMLQQLQEIELSPLKQKIAEYYEEQLEETKRQLRTCKLDSAEQGDEQLAWVHEMKAPLTALKLMIEQMDNRPQQARFEQEWLRMYALLDQQLYIARLQTIEQDSRYEKVYIQPVVYKEIKHFQSWCLEKGIGFEIERLDIEVVTDAKWLAYIVRQLISNAIKYSEPNCEITIYSSYTADGHVQLHVCDAGKGIAPHDLPRVFQKSYTGSSGRESSAASGMGLYLAKNAADNLGLKLALTSVVGEGTTATIQFPLQNEYTKQFGM